MKKFLTMLCTLALTAALALPLSAQVFTTLASFTGTNGNNSQAPLLQATNGAFYGTTVYGGTNNAGTVFKVAPGGELSTIYNFCSLSNCTDGSQPFSPLIQGTDGYLYGTTNYGGVYGDGTVFKMTLGGSLITLHSFNGSDGFNPQGGLVQASNGDFYGNATFGGESSYGTIFRISSTGDFATMHFFTNGSDGSTPYAAPVQASDGNLYGTVFHGGDNGAGVAYKMTPSGTFTPLYAFCAVGGCPDGANPLGALIQASDGNLYGTTSSGGNLGSGTVYRLTSSGALTTLYSFCQEFDCHDGGSNIARLVQATNGLMYGVNRNGGHGFGNIFSISTSGAYATVYTFCAVTGCPDGENPDDQGLIQATNGKLYGTTPAGGSANEGTVYSLSIGSGPLVETNSIK